MKRIYLDYAAATPVDPRVVKAMSPYFSKNPANPSALHKDGVEASRAVANARKNIAKHFSAHADEIIFTGSATESVNLALRGVISAWQRKFPERTPEVISTAIEHDAVLTPLREFEKMGVRVTYLPVDTHGRVLLSELKKHITENTILMSVMYANNEVGTIQPIREIAQTLRKWKKTHNVAFDAYPYFHVDATQAINYCDINILRLGPDMLSLNAAKIYGPKGIGLLVLRRHRALLPLISGGGQEHGLRAGTENVPAIVGFAEALAITEKMKKRESKRCSALRDGLIKDLKKLPHLTINGGEDDRLPNNVNFSIDRCDHEFLALALDARGFAVATKSACNEGDEDTSHVLSALVDARGGAGERTGIRVTIGRTTKKGDLMHFVRALKKILHTMIVV